MGRGGTRLMLGYSGHTHATIDVCRGYEKALRLDREFNVQVFDFHLRLAFYYETLNMLEKAGRLEAAEVTRRPGDYQILASDAMIIDVVEYVPQAILIVNGLLLHRHAYDLLNNLGIPTVILFTESPYLDEMQATILAKADCVVGALTNDRNSVDVLQKASGKPVRYLPHSYDPEVHRPEAANGYASDLFFFGTMWPEREALFEKLKADLGGTYRVDLDGIALNRDDELGRLTENRELAGRYAGSRIALNFHRTAQNINPKAGEIQHIAPGLAYSLGPRAFEIAACGAMQLCDDTRPELREVFGDTVPVYRDDEECVRLARYYLEHEDERRALADAARARVADCTFERRANDILIPFLWEVI